MKARGWGVGKAESTHSRDWQWHASVCNRASGPLPSLIPCQGRMATYLGIGETTLHFPAGCGGVTLGSFITRKLKKIR